MKRIGLLFGVLLFAVPGLFAQGVPSLDHGEVGAFFNYTRLHNAGNANFYGIGGRTGFNVHSNVQFEGEIAYDFQQNYDTQVNLGAGSFVSQRSQRRMVHGLFGPKFQLGTGAFRAFVTVKGGFINFSADHNLANQIATVPNGGTNGAFYPGGGFEIFAGPLGARFEVGDEMYFDNGTNHNLRVTVGPQFRF